MSFPALINSVDAVRRVKRRRLKRAEKLRFNAVNTDYIFGIFCQDVSPIKYAFFKQSSDNCSEDLSDRDRPLELQLSRKKLKIFDKVETIALLG
jgi:hypothetical protein